jgi:hypothetical protein
MPNSPAKRVVDECGCAETEKAWHDYFGQALECPLRRGPDVGGAGRRPHPRRSASWFPRLFHETPEQRAEVRISPNGLHWESLDEDISITGLLAGRSDQAALPKSAA